MLKYIWYQTLGMIYSGHTYEYVNSILTVESAKIMEIYVYLFNFLSSYLSRQKMLTHAYIYYRAGNAKSL